MSRKHRGLLVSSFSCQSGLYRFYKHYVIILDIPHLMYI